MRLLWGTSAMALAVSAVPALANSAAEMHDRDTIVVTAQQTIEGGQVSKKIRVGVLGDSDVFSTPFSTKGFTADFIRDMGARNVNDIVAYDPSIRMSLAPTNVLDQSSIRGFLISSGSYLFDNLPGIAPHYGSIPVSHFERIDIFKGPASALSAAVGVVGGNLNLVPKRALDVPTTSITMGVQSDLLVTGHADIGRRIGDDGAFGVRLNVSGEKGELFDTTKRQQIAATAAVDFRRGPARLVVDAGYIKYKSEGSGTNYTLLANATLPALPGARFATMPRWYVVDNETYYVVGTAEVDIVDNVTAYVRYGQNHQYVQRSGPSTSGTLNGIGQFAVTGYYYGPWRNVKKTGEVGLRADVTTGPFKHHLVLSALQFKGGLSEFGGVTTTVAGLPSGSIFSTYNAIPNPFAGGFPPDNIVNAVQPKQESIAIADDISFNDTVRLILSARRQHLEQGVYSQTKMTPTVAALVKVGGGVSLYANYAEALTQGATAPVTAANPGEQLPPYVSRQREVGAKWNAGKFCVTLAYFKIAQDFAVTNSANRFVIGGEQTNKGVELEAFGEPLPGFRIIGGGAWIDGVQSKTATGNTTGKKALGVPEWTVNLGLEHDLQALPGVTLSGRYIYTSKAYVNLTNTQVVPSWDRFDASARYKFQINDVSMAARVGVTNVFNKGYWVTGGRNSISVGIPRTWFASVSADF